MVPPLSEAMLDVVADALVDKGYVLLSDIIPQEVSLALLAKMRAAAIWEFEPAAIGRGIDQQIDTKIRADKISWLDKKDAVDNDYLQLMEQLREGLNRRLFMGLFDYESHYAVYESGAFYRKHVDALKGSQNRILTTVFFLNPHWQTDHGGELIIYDEDDSQLETVPPRMGTMAIFMSERFPHEVRESFATRISIAGWFRVSYATHGF
ncbi:2OG-Fe(II) oxygenase [Shewanella sp.]|uniref:2OG-Fe(II) oxygenase n=2 Tax=Shewanella sp. TaxID=50422 RepID=UPI004053E5FD